MKCKSHDKDGECKAEATVEVFWPGQTTHACDRHAQGITRLAVAMGFAVDCRPIPTAISDSSLCAACGGNHGPVCPFV